MKKWLSSELHLFLSYQETTKLNLKKSVQDDKAGMKLRRFFKI